MLHRINKALPLTWIDPNTLQIGLDNSSQVFTQISVAQEKIIESLYSGILEGQEQSLDEALKIESGSTANLIKLLGGLVYSAQEQKYGPWHELAFAELARASLDYEVNGEMVLAERWQRTVHLDQLDKSGLLMAKALLAAGVGKILSHDTGVILNTDLGELGYPANELGKSRLEVANQICNSLSLTKAQPNRIKSLATSGSDQKVSFAVTIGHLALSPRTYSRWLARDVNHLAINFELSRAMVSPIVRPGLTACLNCFQEQLVDSDSSWPIVASQLVDLPRVRDDVSGLLTSVGLAVRSILRDLDEQAGFQFREPHDEYSLGYQVEYSSGNISRLKFHKHKLCACQEFTEKD